MALNRNIGKRKGNEQIQKKKVEERKKRKMYYEKDGAYMCMKVYYNDGLDKKVVDTLVNEAMENASFPSGN